MTDQTPESTNVGSVGDVLQSVFATIQERKQNPKPNSYTNSLFDKGIDEITKKVGEEAIEVIIAAQHQGNERLISEMSDLAYHCLVLLSLSGLTSADIAAELSKRHQG